MPDRAALHTHLVQAVVAQACRTALAPEAQQHLVRLSLREALDNLYTELARLRDIETRHHQEAA